MSPSRSLYEPNYLRWENYLMSIQSRNAKLACLATVLALLAACTTKPPVQNAAPSPQALVKTARPAPVTSSVLPGSVQDFRVNVGDSVHFAYNKYNVDEDDKPLLQRQAQWLIKYASVRVTIEGHCDERGTREYNLALGARRASAVKKTLISDGVSSARIDTISYGKERPICTDSDESCWAQNRRGVTTIKNGAAGS
jgi:peptidoglycan-associated lipoprotein